MATRGDASGSVCFFFWGGVRSLVSKDSEDLCDFYPGFGDLMEISLMIEWRFKADSMGICYFGSIVNPGQINPG